MRHYRWGVFALVAAVGYGAVVAVAAAVATARRDIGLLWRFTLFFKVNEDVTLRDLLANVDVTAVWANALVLLAAGGLWGWALWQGLRGPVAERPPVTDRGVLRLRVALYVAAGSWLVCAVAPAWPVADLRGRLRQRDHGHRRPVGDLARPFRPRTHRPIRPAGPISPARPAVGPGLRVMVRYADTRPRLGDSVPSYGLPNLR